MKTLFGRHGVQTLDGTAHRHRKQMLLSVMSDESVAQLTQLVRRQWDDDLPRWEASRQVVLFEEAGRILCRAVSAWAGRDAIRRLRRPATEPVHHPARIPALPASGFVLTDVRRTMPRDVT